MWGVLGLRRGIAIFSRGDFHLASAGAPTMAVEVALVAEVEAVAVVEGAEIVL